jgi:hypothetical protein
MLENSPVSDFMKFCLVILQLSHAVDRHDEANKCIFATSWWTHQKMHLHVIHSEVIMIPTTKQMLLILWLMVTGMIEHLLFFPQISYFKAILA